MDRDLCAEVSKYEDFVHDRLLPDLRRTVAYENVLKRQVKEYATLMQEIDVITLQPAAQLKVCLEVEKDVYKRAQITDTTRMMVNVGQDVFVEFSALEALQFCYEKIYCLQHRIAQLQDRKVDIKTHLDLVVANLEALRASSPAPAPSASPAQFSSSPLALND